MPGVSVTHVQMNVHVSKARHQKTLISVDQLSAGRDLYFTGRTNRRDATTSNHHDLILDHPLSIHGNNAQVH